MHLFQFHNDTFLIFTVSFGCVQRRHNKILVERLGGITPTTFGRGMGEVDRPHRLHGVGACSEVGYTNTKGITRVNRTVVYVSNSSSSSICR